jgi:hypothetical protein
VLLVAGAIAIGSKGFETRFGVFSSRREELDRVWRVGCFWSFGRDAELSQRHGMVGCGSPVGISIAVPKRRDDVISLVDAARGHLAHTSNRKYN